MADLDLDEVAVAGQVDEVLGQHGTHTEVAGDVDELVEEVAGVAGGDVQPALAVVLGEDVHHGGLVELNAFDLAVATEDLAVLLVSRGRDLDLVANAAQERGITQAAR